MTGRFPQFRAAIQSEDRILLLKTIYCNEPAAKHESFILQILYLARSHQFVIIARTHYPMSAYGFKIGVTVSKVTVDGAEPALKRFGFFPLSPVSCSPFECMAAGSELSFGVNVAESFSSINSFFSLRIVMRDLKQM